jgi:hypothetical protein
MIDISATTLPASGIFLDIVNRVKSEEIQYIKKNEWQNLQMSTREHPRSIKESEFRYIHDIIVTHELTSGVEISTGCGISGLAAASGFAALGRGRLISIDAYVEENSETPTSYRDQGPSRHEAAHGFRMANAAAKEYNVDAFVKFCVGWSPDDVASILEENGVTSIDYAFSDGGHFPEQVIADVKAIVPFLADKYAFVFHDMYFDEDTVAVLEKLIGPIDLVITPPLGENLSVALKLS